MINLQESNFDEYLAAKNYCGTVAFSNSADITIMENERAFDSSECQLKWQSEFYIWQERDSDTFVTYIDLSVNPTIPNTETNTESPFDELDEKLTSEEKIKKIIDYVRLGSNFQFGDELAAKLNFLNELLKEDPDEGTISVDSMRNFICFLQNASYLKCPNIALTPSNEIHAQWRKAPNRHFAVVFSSTGETRFVIFIPNSKNYEMTDRLSGITSVDSLFEIVKPCKLLEWVS